MATGMRGDCPTGWAGACGMDRVGRVCRVYRGGPGEETESSGTKSIAWSTWRLNPPGSSALTSSRLGWAINCWYQPLKEEHESTWSRGGSPVSPAVRLEGRA